MNNELISRSALNKTIDDITWYHINPHGELTEGAFDDGDAFYKAEDIYNAIDNAPTVEERMSYVQQAVNTIMHDSTGDSDVDKAFRNAARLIQNAIDGETPEFEHIEREPEKAKESEIIKAYTKGFDTGVETVKDERPQGKFSRKDLESWLYQIAMNNIGTDFEKSVVEIIHRLDGFERFVSERKGGAE